MNLIFHFPGSEAASLPEVGGKAHSLIVSAQAGFPVPPGFVLSTNFFATWIAQLKQSTPWQEFLRAHDGSSANLNSSCDALKQLCANLAFDSTQTEALQQALDQVPDLKLMAVRSSAPEEDLEGASFAGGYLSIMGVTSAHLANAIREAFASCLDYRVYVYKKMRGFDPLDPKIAIIVQMQIASEVAGVGFSLNPVTNDFDEAVINSNWGLGETVVAGASTPDSFIVDKAKFHVIEKQLGSKGTSIWLQPDGSLETRENFRSNEETLNNDQIRRITNLIKQVETAYKKPIDIEWALSANDLYLLQARPITAYVPVAPDLVTAPGQTRQLFLDVTISVQGISKPMSVLGTDTLRHFAQTMGGKIFGKEAGQFFFGRLARIEHGRAYVTLSDALATFGKQKLSAALSNVDAMASAIVANIDEKKYVTANNGLPHHIKAAIMRRLALNFPLLWSVWSKPEEAHLRSQKAFALHMQKMEALAVSPLPLPEYVEQVLKETGTVIGQYSAPLFFSGKVAQSALLRIFANEPLIHQLDKALPNNVTVKMGLELSKLAKLLPAKTTFAELEQRLQAGNLPPQFVEGWQQYLQIYGHRGPLEIDVASARYRDDPKMLLSQISALTFADDPALRHQSAQAEREAAYDALLKGFRGFNKMIFKRLYSAVLNHAGYRETHKYYLTLGFYLIKQRVLQEAQKLFQAGRLDTPAQVFDLKLLQLYQAIGDSNLDLRALAKANREFPDKLAAAPRLPQVFDSRGRILRPPMPALKPGEFAGAPISAGVARGPAKVLHWPDEKPFLSGDVLVARATDPGWTPLFASASAVVLEVGGMLQHGALVAREYGLPCVAGVVDATTALKDGTIIEVDGNAGIVRFISASE